ncbi:S-adenosyl-L-methionine-dependent methyltransferase [Parachaetomium inaequale]|uniref:Sterol 24-C-methyltransferase n=1 Tax=Parachaetomium inaequale TaxID=2588326 RepID=A0AAN6SWB0_9PEZI|nr:S-adenosyl-L-methionine-dependent methyltransferase [Parachaetomium inaequale]
MASHMPANYAEDRLHLYLTHWTRDPSNVSTLDVGAISWATEEESREREKKYCEVASDYHDLVTPLYEQGWGQQFHYTPITPGLSIRESMTAYEKTFAGLARLEKGMRVLDLGRGIGGPARTIASAVGCNILGITNSAWHVERGTALTKEAGLDKLVSLVHGDFLKLPFPDESFDAAYSAESLCYAPDPAEVYREIKRVLKPGAPFTFHDFAMTENSPAPWYYGPAGDILWAWRMPGWPDFWKVFKMWDPFRGFAHLVYRLMILVGMMPPEVSTLMDTMWYCTKSVVTGGRMGIFTPMYVFVCRKPARGRG